jgi:hypothetical protein
MIKITESLTGFKNDPKVSEADIKNLADRILTVFRQKQAAENQPITIGHSGREGGESAG